MNAKTERVMDERIERVLAALVVHSLLKSGYLVSIASECTNSCDPKDHEIWKSNDADAVVKAMMASDEDWVKVYEPNSKSAAENGDEALPFGWVRMIWGNGVDCISDYTTNLEKALERPNKLAQMIDSDPSIMFASDASRIEAVDKALVGGA